VPALTVPSALQTPDPGVAGSMLFPGSRLVAGLSVQFPPGLVAVRLTPPLGGEVKFVKSASSASLGCTVGPGLGDGLGDGVADGLGDGLELQQQQHHSNVLQVRLQDKC
jgi:hypothetical protein